MAVVYTVKNLQTGIIHTVNEGHWALDDDNFEVVMEPVRKKQVKNEPARKRTKSTKPRTRK